MMVDLRLPALRGGVEGSLFSIEDPLFSLSGVRSAL